MIPTLREMLIGYLRDNLLRGVFKLDVNKLMETGINRKFDGCAQAELTH
jgi:hypothetical protein